MFGSEILDVAIGVVFIYLLLSLVCSTLTELISRIFAMRSHNLEDGIRNLLNDPDGKDLAKKFYKHPLIAKLAAKGKGHALMKRSGRPSYIPSRTFTLALLDIIAPVDPTKDPKALKDIRDIVGQLSDSSVKVALLTLIDEAGNDLKKARKNIENWFDDVMERVSGWYKRKAQLITICLAFVVSVLLNADTFMIANSLSRDSAFRNAIVTAAAEATKQPLQTESEDPLSRLSELKVELQQLELPVGWIKASEKYEIPREVPIHFIDWFYKILGLLFTTLAVSLGAPFWFKALDKLVSLRSAGKEPEKTSKENAK